MLELERIRIDGGTQPRTELNQQAVDDYAQAMLDGQQFPPVVVFWDGSDYWLADGFHRYFAAKKAKLGKIVEKVEPGTKRDAILYSLSVNAEHGLRRSNADKRKAVMTMLQDDEWKQWSDGEIARQCRVSQPFVSKERRDVTQNVLSEKPTERTYTNKHGSQSTMKVAAIGKQSKADAPDDDYDPRDDELAEARSAIKELAEQNEALKATASINVLPEEERQTAGEVIEELQSRVKALEAENDALKSSRDRFQTESAEKQKQINYWKKKYEGLKNKIGSMGIE